MSSINNKEKNFISAVVYLHNDGARAVEFCRAVAAELDSHFAQYELVVVDDACTDDTVERLRTWGKDQAAPLTILHMSLYHGLENARHWRAWPGTRCNCTGRPACTPRRTPAGRGRSPRCRSWSRGG